jgi:hypothetical protein
MAQFITNATALANYSACLVAVVHHTPLSDEKRLRGGGNLFAGLDLSMLFEKVEGTMMATLEVMKLRDGEIGQKFTAHLRRIVLGADSDGDEVSTLMVDKVEPGAAEGVKAPQGRDEKDADIVRAEFVKTYDRLADNAPPIQL